MLLQAVAPDFREEGRNYWEQRMFRAAKEGARARSSIGRKSAPTRRLNLKPADATARPSAGYIQAASGASLAIAHKGRD